MQVLCNQLTLFKLSYLADLKYRPHLRSAGEGGRGEGGGGEGG